MTAKQVFSLFVFLGLVGIGYVVYWALVLLPVIKMNQMQDHIPYDSGNYYIIPGIILLVSIFLLLWGVKGLRSQRLTSATKAPVAGQSPEATMKPTENNEGSQPPQTPPLS